MPFALRDHRPEDFHTLWKIDQSCFPPGIAYTQFELRSYMHRTTSFTLVAEATDVAEAPNEVHSVAGMGDQNSRAQRGILGFVVAERMRGTGHIITIDVRSAVRREGVGSALLWSAEDRLRVLNCRKVMLETAVDNVNALAFYKKHGYVVTKVAPRYYSNGVDALVLEKSLSSPSSRNLQK